MELWDLLAARGAKGSGECNVYFRRAAEKWSPGHSGNCKLAKETTCSGLRQNPLYSCTVTRRRNKNGNKTDLGRKTTYYSKVFPEFATDTT